MVLANSSNEHVRVPGNMKAHSVAIHPSATLKAVAGMAQSCGRDCASGR